MRQTLTRCLIEHRHAFERISTDICSNGQFLQNEPIHGRFIAIQIEYVEVRHHAVLKEGRPNHLGKLLNFGLFPRVGRSSDHTGDEIGELHP